MNMPKDATPACDAAMERGLLLLVDAEKETDPARRYACAQLAQVYVSAARELRLGAIKSRRYDNISAEQVGPPRAPQPPPAVLEGSGDLPAPPFGGAIPPLDTAPSL